MSFPPARSAHGPTAGPARAIRLPRRGRSVPRPADGSGIRTARLSRRKFRVRGRRGQVAPVATILGLLLVVTMMANYIATVLPAQMSSNEMARTFLVENQVGHLVALATDVSQVGHAGTQVIQPITLGSEGDPPFAAPDHGQIVAGATGTGMAVNFSLTGSFNPPSGGTSNKGYSGSCTDTPGGTSTYSISCGGGATVIWNFSLPNQHDFTLSGTGSFTVHANFTTNNSIISVGTVGGAHDSVEVIGSNDTIYLNTTGGASLAVTIVGSYDSLITSSAGGGIVVALVVGNHDSTSMTGTGGATFRLTGYGTNDTFTDSASGGGTTNVYFNGFNLNNPVSSSCPYRNTANTDSVSGSAGTVVYNDTTYTHSGSTGNASGWTYSYVDTPASATACPFVGGSTVSQTLEGAAFSVQLFNAYSPESVIGFDEGAVVGAAPGGFPTFIDPPDINVVGASATIWFPVLTSVTIPGDTGSGTTNVVLILVATFFQSWPAGGLSITSGTTVTMTVLSPFGSLWQSYFQAQGLTATCTLLGSPSKACPATFSVNGPVGKVVVSLALTSITLEVAEFSLKVV